MKRQVPVFSLLACLDDPRLPANYSTIMKRSEHADYTVVETITEKDAETRSGKEQAQSTGFCMHPLEFLLYFTILVTVAAAHLVWAVFISDAFTDSGFYVGKLEDMVQGWIPGRLLDLSNGNWSFLRKHIPLFVPWFLLMAIISRTLQWQFPKRLEVRQRVQAVLTLCFLGHVHGRSTILMLALSLINFGCCKLLSGYRVFPAVLWILNCLLYFARGGITHGTDLFSYLKWFSEIKPPLLISFPWPYSLCRMISFGMDCHWAKLKRTTPVRDETKKPVITSLNPIDDHHEAEQYALISYFCYVFFPPLYTDGPIITYNNFLHQFRGELYSDYKKIAKYVARMWLLFLITDISLHYNYLDNLASSGLWREMLGAFGMGTVMFSSMLYYFFHHLVLWRFYRAWSLIYGIDPPEDVIRCIMNNYDIKGFWRYWHASVNRWCVRYIYVPLGGAKYRALNIWVVFFFIAVWHEISLSFLKWSWIICLIFAVDTGVRASVRTALIASLAEKWWFRYIKAFATSFELYFIYLANLGGFIVGVKKIPIFVKTMSGDPTYAIIIFAAFYSAVQMVIAIKHFEQVRGKRLCPVMI